MEKNDHLDNGTDALKEPFDPPKDEGEPGPSWGSRFEQVLKWFFAGPLLLGANLWEGIRSTYINLFKSDGEVSLKDDIKGAFRHIPLRKKGFGYAAILFVMAAYLMSGVYTVEPGEEAVARLFGKDLGQTITEGLHYRLPWPFESTEKVNVMEIRRVAVGIPVSEEPLLFPRTSLQASSSGGGGHGGHGAHSSAAKTPSPQPVSARNQFFTGDENILEIKMNIQYRIKDASDYLFNVDSPDELVPDIGRVAVTEIFAGTKVDDLLTTAKSQIQRRISLKMQRMLDEYRAGLQIVNVNLQEVNPPKDVAQAFRDVASASEEREEKTNKAQGYWNTVIPEARGKAHKLISDAEGYREEVVNRASGDADKFLTMLKEYQGAKEITEYRLYLERIEKVLAKAKKFVIDSKKERVNLKFVK